MPKFPPASSEKLDVARYACVFLLCRTKIYSAFLVWLILGRCTNFCSGRPSTAELVGFVAYTDSFQNTLAGKSKNRRFYFLEKQGTSEFVRRLGTLSKSLAIFLVCRDKFERFLSFSEIETPVFRFCSPVVCFETNLYMPRISTQTGLRGRPEQKLTLWENMEASSRNCKRGGCSGWRREYGEWKLGTIE